MQRLNWDEFFISLADLVKERATCPLIQVGAVIVDPDNQIVAIGYNGAPSGMPHCTEAGCVLVDGRCRRTVHAEESAIQQARLHSRSLEGCRIYTSTYPCDNCTRLIGQYGIREVIYMREYPNALTPRIAEAFGITLRKVPSRVDIRVSEQPVFHEGHAAGPESEN